MLVYDAVTVHVEALVNLNHESSDVGIASVVLLGDDEASERVNDLDAETAIAKEADGIIEYAGRRVICVSSDADVGV